MTFQFDPLYSFDQQQRAQDAQEAFSASAAPPTLLRFELYRRLWAEGDPQRAARIRDFAERVVAAENTLHMFFTEPYTDAALNRLDAWLEGAP